MCREKNIIVIDDDEQVLKSMEKILTRERQLKNTISADKPTYEALEQMLKDKTLELEQAIDAHRCTKKERDRFFGVVDELGIVLQRLRMW